MAKKATMDSATVDFRTDLAEQISQLIGLRVDIVYSDEGDGFYYYIRHLVANRPVVAFHYRGYLMVILPESDCRRLETGEITVPEYIQNAYFNYGRYWGGGSLIGGGYWQPLESTTGIHDTGRINRYLRILGCRTLRHSSGYRPSCESCANCMLCETSCPASPCNQTGSWDDEIQEPDDRVKLYRALRDRIQRDTGFEVGRILSHDAGAYEVQIFASCQTNHVEIRLNQDLLNDLLYHPRPGHDWIQLADQFTYVASGYDYILDPWKYQAVENDGHVRERCLEFWGERIRLEWERWEQSKAELAKGQFGTSRSTTQPPVRAVPTPNIFQRIGNSLRSIFSRN